MGLQEIVDYVMNTPENTNSAVLKSVVKNNLVWEDIKNKPFYEEGYVVADVTFTGNEEYNVIKVDELPIEKGQIYLLEVDDDRYEIKCTEEFGSGHAIINFRGEDYGVDFNIQANKANPPWIDCSKPAHIVIKKQVVVPIDSKFLPKYLQPQEDYKEGSMIIERATKTVPEESRYFVASSSSGGEIHDSYFAEFLWENRKIVKLIASERIDMSIANSYKEDETFSDGTRRIYAKGSIDPTKRDSFFVTIYPDGRIQYGDMGSGWFDKGWIVIPEHEEQVIADIAHSNAPFTTFFGPYERITNYEDELPLYVDEERTIMVTRELQLKASKRGPILIVYRDGDGYIAERISLGNDLGTMACFWVYDSYLDTDIVFFTKEFFDPIEN